MLNDEIDLEDLESLLYSQVYHSSEPIPPDGTETQTLVVPPVPPEPELPRTLNRYSLNNHPKPTSRYFDSGTMTAAKAKLPPIATPEAEPKKAEALKKRKKWYEKLKVKRRAKKLKKRLEKSEVICLTDSDDNGDEVVPIPVVPDEPKVAEPAPDKVDDEVIYIEPPPIEVINLDPELDESFDKSVNCASAEDECKESNEVSRELDTPDSTTNDFLDNSVQAQHQFNFSLHGSDFRNRDFVRPTNPIADVYETESSCSTTEFNRDINQSVKSVVFSEVEFPKEDIFTENNLESFGNYITPKRVSGAVKVVKSEKKVKKPPVWMSSTDDSSSESEYETEPQGKQLRIVLDRMLPDLSPMGLQPVAASSPKRSEVKKTKKKKKKLKLDVDEVVEEDCSKTRKKKKKSLDGDELDESFKNPTPKKKKKKILEPVEIDDSPDVIEPDDQVRKKKKKKKSISEVSVSSEIELDDDSTATAKRKKKPEIPDDEPNKRKKKKATSISEEIVAETVTEVLQPIDNTSITKKPPEITLIESITIEPPQIKAIEVIEVESEPQCDEVIIKPPSPIIDFEELTVIDEIGSTDIETVSSSSEPDFPNMDDVGHDLQLANCRMHAVNLIDFDVEDVKKTMSNDPNDWPIIAQDRTSLTLRRSQSYRRCTSCNELGHLAFACTNVRYFPKCSLCGGDTHIAAQCPNEVCLQCGAKGDFSRTFCWNCLDRNQSECNLCLMVGHGADVCPDLWRRYCLTINEGRLIQYEGHQLVSLDRQWCSACADCGHLEFQCNFRREYPRLQPRICSYEDVYSSPEDLQAEINLALSQTLPYIPEANMWSLSQPLPPAVESFSDVLELNCVPEPILKIPAPFLKVPAPILRVPAQKLTQLQEKVKKIGNKFQSSTLKQLKCLIRSELKCFKTVRKLKPEALRDQLLQAKRKTLPVDFFRNLNIYLFGAKQRRKGQTFTRRLREFIKDRNIVKLTSVKRKELFQAHQYIFSYERAKVNYIKLLQPYVKRAKKTPNVRKNERKRQKKILADKKCKLALAKVVGKLKK